MLKIISETTTLPEMSLIKGCFNNKKITIQHYLNNDIEVFGSFTEEEKAKVINKYLEQL